MHHPWPLNQVIRLDHPVSTWGTPNHQLPIGSGGCQTPGLGQGQLGIHLQLAPHILCQDRSMMVHRYPMIAYYLPWWIFWFLVSLPAHGFTMFSYSDRIGSLTPPSQRLPLLALETAGPRVMKTCVAALPFETLHLSELPWTQSNQIKMNQAKKIQPAWNYGKKARVSAIWGSVE